MHTFVHEWLYLAAALDVDILNAAVVEGRETAARGLVDSRVSLYTGYNSVHSMYVCIYVCTAAE